MERRYFAQMAGSGLDARAIELANWELKKKVGPLAYIWAGVEALRGEPSRIVVSDGKESATGELVLIGNGKFYGGKFRVHPLADLRDGILEVCVFPKANWQTLVRCAGMFAAGRALPKSVAKTFRWKDFTLTAVSPTPLEVDGENIGHLPARFSVEREGLRIIGPV